MTSFSRKALDKQVGYTMMWNWDAPVHSASQERFFSTGRVDASLLKHTPPSHGGETKIIITLQGRVSGGTHPLKFPIEWVYISHFHG